MLDIGALASCWALASLDLSGCRNLVDIDPLACCSSLTSLIMRGCREVINIDALASCVLLAAADMRNCCRVSEVNPLATCTNLTVLDLKGCRDVASVLCLVSCTLLKSLVLDAEVYKLMKKMLRTDCPLMKALTKRLPSAYQEMTFLEELYIVFGHDDNSERFCISKCNTC